MIAALVLAFREGLEAALILGIVLGVVRCVRLVEQMRLVWFGAGLAAILSLGVGVGLAALGISFEGQAEEILEGTVMLLAAAELTRMSSGWGGRVVRCGSSWSETCAKRHLPAEDGRSSRWPLLQSRAGD